DGETDELRNVNRLRHGYEEPVLNVGAETLFSSVPRHTDDLVGIALVSVDLGNMHAERVAAREEPPGERLIDETHPGARWLIAFRDFAAQQHGDTDCGEEIRSHVVVR